MTSKFRRNNTDKKLNLLQKEHDSILSELSAIEDGTDNNSIMDIINPAFKDLNMNNNNIINVDNMFMKDNLVLESVGVGSCDITMTNDIKQTNSRITSNNTQLTIETIDDNRLVLKAQDSDYVVIDPDNTIYPDAITLSSTVKIDGDIKTNNIFNIGDIQTTTVNGGVILTNPLSSTLDCNNNNITNLTEIKTTGQQLRIVGSPIILENDSSATDIKISNNISMSGGDIKNVNDISCTVVNTQSINVDYITTNNTNNIDINAVLGSLELKSIITNSHSNIDMKNNDLLNVGTLEVNEIKDHVIYKILTAGNEIKYNGRVNVKLLTTSTTPTLLFRIQYTHNCSVYEGRLLSTNYTQGKIWTSPAVCVVNDATIDKNIGGSGVSAIGGTNRASTIDFIINAGYLEGYITANFTDETVSVYDFSVWSDLY